MLLVYKQVMIGGLEIENKKEALDIDAMEETWSLTAIKRDALDTANYDVKKNHTFESISI